MEKVVFELPQQNAAELINVLGQLPTSSGMYPILVTLVAQYKEQENGGGRKDPEGPKQAPKASKQKSSGQTA